MKESTDPGGAVRARAGDAGTAWAVARSCVRSAITRVQGNGFPALAWELNEICLGLPGIAHELGQKFLASADRLEPLTLAGQRLVEECEVLVGVATGRADGHATVETTLEMLKPSIVFLDAWCVAMRRNLAALETSRQSIRKLLGLEATLQSSVSSLRHTPVLFRVEAARLPDTVREGFASLTDEIASIHLQVRDVFSEQFQALRGTLSTIESTIASIRRQAQEVETGVRTRKERAKESLVTVDEEIAANSKREVQLTRMGAGISKEIVQMVVGLQAHDIASQRIEHIGESLQEARDKVAAAGRLWNPFSVTDLVRHARGMVEIQIGQARSLCGYLDRGGSELSAAARRVVEHTEMLDSEGLGLKEFNQVTVAVDGAVQVLLEMVDGARKLVTSAETASRESRTLIAPVTELAARLTGSIESISVRMRLVALNAQIKAIHIGSGRGLEGTPTSANGLETLAAHTAAVSTDITGMGTSIAADLGTLVVELRQAGESFASLESEGTGHAAFLAGDGAAHERQLHEFRDETLRRLQAVGKTADEIRETCSFIEEQTATRASAVEPLRELAAKLSDVAVRLEKLSPELAFAALEERDRSRYTMESERDTHQSVVEALRKGNRDAAALPSEPAAPAAAAADDMDGVELF